MRVPAIAMLPGLLALASAPEGAADPLATFEALGPSSENEVSADGSVVVGVSPDAIALRWTAEGGMAQIANGIALGASADGSVVVGELDSPGHAEAFRWTATTGAVGLGFLPGDVDSVAFDTSADGSQVVGYSIQDQASGWRATAFRWTEAGGMVALGAAPGGAESLARGTSEDGSVVVGELRGTSGSRAFRWTTDLGFFDLGVLPCGAEGSIANDVSADGSVVVGTSGGRAFRWSAARGMQDLPFGSARSVSADGTVVVGGGGSGAIVWTPSGARLLADLLQDYGVNLGGWTLQSATGVSDDGLVIVGHGHEPSLGFQGFRVTLAVAECGNGLDDDGDGLTDFPADPGCADENGLTERLAVVGPGTTRVIIDDFESGDFSLTDAGAVGGESIAQGSLPVLGGSRESAVSIRDSIPGASATIAVGGGFGTWSLTTPGFVNTRFRFWYDRQADGVFGNAAGPYVDLTSGGANRFLLEVAAVTGLVRLDIQVFDSHGFNTSVSFTPPDGGACEIPFGSFVGIDFTSVRNVVLGHRPTLFTDANISFARFATAGPPSVVRVGVEIKPGGEGNPINLRSKGVIPVAILGSESFDASQVDVTKLAFGPAGAAPAHKSGGHLVDVDADGFVDLLSHYRTQETGIAFGDTEACVSGELFDAMAFEGCAAVHARPIER